MNLFKTCFFSKSFFHRALYRNSGIPTPQLDLFTDIFEKKKAEEEKKEYSTGRAWKIEELRIKSTDDLHKLWYVLLIEKNKILSDNVLKRKIQGYIGTQGRMIKVKLSMARLLTVISERKKFCEEYRKKLEDEYIAQKHKVFIEKLTEDQKLKENEVKTPEITHNLIRAKYRDLKRGMDNTEYIKEALKLDEEKQQHKKYLAETYDYKNKKVVKKDEKNENLDENKIIRQFESGFMEQIKSGRLKISQEEVLRSHVKNWKMLNLKQRRIILGFLNARRAKDAKSEFLKELNLLGQKIAYDNLNANAQ